MIVKGPANLTGFRNKDVIEIRAEEGVDRKRDTLGAFSLDPSQEKKLSVELRTEKWQAHLPWCTSNKKKF